MTTRAKGDAIERTAVHLHDGHTVHKRRKSGWDAQTGHWYLTGCGRRLTTAGGAMLTTRDVDCARCRGVTP